MRNYYFRIADLCFKLCLDHDVIVNEHFKEFQLQESEPDFYIEYIPDAELIFCEGERVFSNVGFDVFNEGDYFVRQYVEQKLSRKPYAQGRIEADRRKVTVKYLPDFQYAFTEIANSFSHIGFDELLMHGKRMILHASLIETEFGGILFSGPSGIGKSTQATLWKIYKNSEIINGDRPILGKIDDVWYAWGSPYSGSSMYHKSKKLPVRAIILLKQGKENHIESVSTSVAFKNLYMQTTNNLWNRTYVNRVVEMVGTLAKEIPIYQFTCTPDKEAVVMLDDYLKGGLGDGLKRSET